jgi:hypothetical protein
MKECCMLNQDRQILDFKLAKDVEISVEYKKSGKLIVRSIYGWFVRDKDVMLSVAPFLTSLILCYLGNIMEKPAGVQLVYMMLSAVLMASSWYQYMVSSSIKETVLVMAFRVQPERMWRRDITALSKLYASKMYPVLMCVFVLFNVIGLSENGLLETGGFVLFNVIGLSENGLLETGGLSDAELALCGLIAMWLVVNFVFIARGVMSMAPLRGNRIHMPVGMSYAGNNVVLSTDDIKRHDKGEAAYKAECALKQERRVAAKSKANDVLLKIA